MNFQTILKFWWKEKVLHLLLLEQESVFFVTIIVRELKKTVNSDLHRWKISNKRLNKIKTPTVVLGDFNGREKWMYQNIKAYDFHVCKSNGDTYNFDGFSVVIYHQLGKRSQGESAYIVVLYGKFARYL